MTIPSRFEQDDHLMMRNGKFPNFHESPKKAMCDLWLL